ncbi:hypothetical protein BBO99_00006194 [Phytophthora kernoviae]|uniref:EF-hand domain-containing protein n=1 Tax=Phytophthora kernoviae TaxID=325452 RepID=A0A3R7IE94_9STRA|nr:hypothetical protein JM18_005147 [Phytophthora kernoviae]KAG2528295.1 hypothetical protein JM16_001280 [Phytophthora kernoviae]RLM96095.1 hypothetical protein BBI17_006318 [Phytophthora kernoviae]RLN78122.1 hypothetical protein BBO99_00006194 [Phytophthora kernoviae]
MVGRKPPRSTSINDLTAPLNTGEGSERDSASAASGSKNGDRSNSRASNSLVHRRQRKGTVGSEDFADKAAKLRIDFDGGRKSAMHHQRFSPEFRFNVQMSLRVACGVIIASCIQTRERDNDNPGKQWALFPSWYYLGGLSYCAVAVIFTTGKNIGSTLKIVWQAFFGVGMALVYNLVLFSCVNMHTYDEANTSYDGYTQIDQAFSASVYWVNRHNFYVVLPWMVIFTVVILVVPLSTTTQRFAVGNNLYFALTIINPISPDTESLKTSDEPNFRTANILRNLEVYFLVGLTGSLISLAIMFIPYPIFAITRLRENSKHAAEDILDLLNIIVDSYCFKNKNVEHMNFLKLKLQRKFDAAAARHQRMQALMDDTWWEQSFGFSYVLQFHRPIMFNYVKLVGSLISDLRTLSYAMQLEKYENLHFTYMKVLQREIYVIQTRSGELLNEISYEAHSSSREVKLRSMSRLETQMEATLHRYRSTQNRTLQKHPVTVEEMAGNVPLNLFLFSLNSFCSTMIGFQDAHNKKNYTDTHRIRSFIVSSISKFFTLESYTDGNSLLTAFRGSLAIVIGIFMSVYVYSFNSTVPSTVAYVMGNHLGGSFSVTVNRVGGVVAGSVVPSVFQFFFAQICHPEHLNVVLADVVLFAWVAMSMYVCFVGGYGSLAGVVSAFVATGIMMRQSDMCSTNPSDDASTIAISSYSSLAQTSVGIVLFIVVELMMCPKSASSLLRRNIQKTLRLQLEAFETLFGHHLASSNTMDADTMEALREILQVKIPAKHLQQAALLIEAQAEPALWRPAFSLQKYEKVLESSRRLLNNNTLLFKLVRWFNYRVEQNHVQRDGVDIRDSVPNNKEGFNTHIKWQEASAQFQSSVTDSFKTLLMLFGDTFLYSDPDQTAIFMQMKEAFRLADKDCSGEIDAEEVADMLETIFVQSGAVKEGEIHKYVEEFMRIVDKDNSGLVSFEEFMEALENGLKLEVEVYTRRKPTAPALVAARRELLPCISEDAVNEESGNDDLSQQIEDDDEGEAGSVHPSSSVGVSVPNGTYDHQKLSLPSGAVTTDDSKVSTSRAAVPPNESYRRSSQASSGRKVSSVASSVMCREFDVLNVEDFSTSDIAAQMKTAYVEWLLEGKRYEKVSMEELLLLNCLVSGAEGIAKSLTDMAEIVVAS